MLMLALDVLQALKVEQGGDNFLARRVWQIF